MIIPLLFSLSHTLYFFQCFDVLFMRALKLSPLSQHRAPESVSGTRVTPKNTGQGCSGGSQQRSPGRKLKVSLGKFHDPLTSLGWTQLWTDNIPSTTKCSQEAGPDCGHIRGAEPSQHQPLQRSLTSSSTQIHRWASHTSKLSEAQQCQGTFTSLLASCYCTWKF